MSENEPKWLQEFCDTEGCYEKSVAVVKRDPINGDRYCPECLEHEGEEQGWW